MCFTAKKIVKDAEFKSGKNEPVGLKQNLSTSKCRADPVGIPATKRRNQPLKPTDKIAVNGASKKKPPLSSTLQNEDLNNITSMNQLFRKLVEESSKDLRLDQWLLTWRMNYRSRVDATTTPELESKFHRNLKQLVENLNKAVSTAISINLILSKSSPTSQLFDKINKSERLLNQFDQIWRCLNSSIFSHSGSHFWVIPDSQTPTVQALAIRLENTVSRLNQTYQSVVRKHF